MTDQMPATGSDSLHNFTQKLISLEGMLSQLHHIALETPELLLKEDAFHYSTCLALGFAVTLILFPIILSAIPISNKAMRRRRNAACDVVFLAHPTTVLSSFSLWLGEESATNTWEGRIWMLPFWPFVLLVSLAYHFISPLFAGPYLCVDAFTYGKVSTEVWLSKTFGWQFMSSWFWRRTERNIQDCIIAADGAGIKVMGLGALNKAEFINAGGSRALDGLDLKCVRLVHGNTLTAAVVLENIMRVRQDGQSVFLTGATSKVGRAIALALVLKTVPVVAYTSSAERFEALLEELAQIEKSKNAETLENGGNRKSTSLLARASNVADGVHHRLWCVGKYDTSVSIHMPYGSVAVVFAVPSPLDAVAERSRKDLRIIDGGTLRIDPCRCGWRSFPILLPWNIVYGCHAAAIVHATKGWKHHEVGPVDIDKLDSTFEAARECGFELVHKATSGTKTCRASEEELAPLCGGHLLRAAASESVNDYVNEDRNRDTLPSFCSVVVVGGGPAGLAAAGALSQAGERNVIILERGSSISGSWQRHYSNLKITSRRVHCGLPGYPVPESYEKELTASSYIKYMSAYASRFDLDVRLGVKVTAATESHNSRGRFQIATACGALIHCDHLVVATGMNARPTVPRHLASEQNLCLSANNSRSNPYVNVSSCSHIVHSSDVGDLTAYVQERVLIVGCGNSASDIACELLRLRRSSPYSGARTPPVHLSIRSVPPIIMREWGPLSVEWVSRLVSQHLPPAVADLVLDTFATLKWGLGWKKKLFPEGVLNSAHTWKSAKECRVPLIDKGPDSFVENVKRGEIRLHGTVSSSHRASATFDGEENDVYTFDKIILATGFRSDYGDWVRIDNNQGTSRIDNLDNEHVHVQKPHVKPGRETYGLWFLGFSNGPALLPLHQIGVEARSIAKLITTETVHGFHG